MKWPVVSDIDVSDKAVLVRGDLDVDDIHNPRIDSVREVITLLQDRGAKRIKVIGHGGNIGMVSELGVDLNWDLRADVREKEDSVDFARELALGFDVYINESFAVSHRKHTSIVALPTLMKSAGLQVAIGPRFAKELEVLGQIPNPKSQTPNLLVVGGTKVEDKNRYAAELETKGWMVLRGGLLTGAILREDGLDISTESVANYKSQIANAKFIVAAGVMGKYEDPNCEYGTKEILHAIANNIGAIKIAGGGDIEAAISKYGLSEKFDWISVGGGAMLQYITTGTLVGLDAVA
ncbi:MAG: phosphoglycerate kinase [Patescibacteria group bacterium]